MTLLGVCGDKNGFRFPRFGIDGEILEIIFVCFGPLCATGRQTVAGAGILRMANNQYYGILRSFLGIGYDEQCGTMDDCNEKASAHCGGVQARSS
jgi:hypothetical protein